MSSSEPSANVAFTVSLPTSPAFANAYSGEETVIAVTVPLPGVRAAPDAIQSRSNSYCQESLEKRRPPPCGTWPVAFRRSRL